MFPLEGVIPGLFIKVGNLAGDLYWKVAGIKAGDASHTAAPGQHTLAERLLANTVWANYPQTRDDDSLHTEFVSLSVCKFFRALS